MGATRKYSEKKGFQCPFDVKFDFGYSHIVLSSGVDLDGSFITAADGREGIDDIVNHLVGVVPFGRAGAGGPCPYANLICPSRKTRGAPCPGGR